MKKDHLALSRLIAEYMLAKSSTHASLALLLGFLMLPHISWGAVVEYDLTVAQEPVRITERATEGMTINGTIPGPTLHFKEGDLARIRVHNQMSESTSIHWHGILVPPGMDGVPFISFPPIQPGATFTYEFPIRQSGTYWYHTHSGIQEQQGLYGAMVIEPRNGARKVDRDYAVVFSDWTDEDPHAVIRTLKRGSEWYSIEKGAAQSLLGAARLGMAGQYLRRELQRMPPMDISDVAYDRFLANGKPETELAAEPGETVRLRIVNGSATTYFHLQFAGGPMQIVAADGQDVEPVDQDRFLITVAETYDVLVKVPASGSYEFRATAHDGSAFASVWLGSGDRHPAPAVPRPNLYHLHGMGGLSLKRIFALTPAGSMGMPDRDVKAGKFDQPGMMGMGNMHMNDMDMGDMSGNDMSSMEHPHDMAMKMPMPAAPPAPASRDGKRYGNAFGLFATDISSSSNLAMDGMDSRRPWSPYAQLRSVRSTAFPTNRPVHEVRLTLDGDMERYVWLLNNKPLSESDSIQIHKGELVRFIMINRTMMHHPMHLHGHFFRVINGQGDYSPLKHTVDVAPMSTTVIEFDANEFGDWFFHCHLLYHMKSGMARVVHYEGYTLNPQLAAVRPLLYKESWYAWGQADMLYNMSEGFLMLSDTRHILAANWEVGWQGVEDTETEGILTYDYYFNRFFTAFAGADLQAAADEMEETRAVAGVRYLLPLNLEARIWIDSDGGVRANLEKTVTLTPRLSIMGETEYDTHEKWEGAVAARYMINRTCSVVGKWHSDYDWGAGLQIRF